MKERCFDFINNFEEVLNDQRDFLVSLVEDHSVSTTIRDLAIRLIILIGNIRESGEDYLVAFNLIHSQNLKINLYHEMRHSLAFEDQKDEEENKQEAIFNVKTDGRTH